MAELCVVGVVGGAVWVGGLEYGRVEVEVWEVALVDLAADLVSLTTGQGTNPIQARMAFPTTNHTKDTSLYDERPSNCTVAP